jgi:class 3 adenylate cyclase
VLVSEAVANAVDDPSLRFEPADKAELKGIAEPVPPFRAISKPDVAGR